MILVLLLEIFILLLELGVLLLELLDLGMNLLELLDLAMEMLVFRRASGPADIIASDLVFIPRYLLPLSASASA